MSYREKSAWAFMIVLTLTAGFYAWEVIGAWIAAGDLPRPSIKLAIVYIVLVVIGMIVTQASIAATAGKEAELPADEREIVAIQKAGNWSGILLAFGVVAGALHYFQYDDGRSMFHIIIGALMLSQILEYAFQILFFRRGV